MQKHKKTIELDEKSTNLKTRKSLTVLQTLVTPHQSAKQISSAINHIKHKLRMNKQVVPGVYAYEKHILERLLMLQWNLTGVRLAHQKASSEEPNILYF